jgi:adenylate cyclase
VKPSFGENHLRTKPGVKLPTVALWVVPGLRTPDSSMVTGVPVGVPGKQPGEPTTANPVVVSEAVLHRASALAHAPLDCVSTIGCVTDIEAKGDASTLEAIVRSAADAIVTADDSGNIVGWNPAAERLFGYVEDDVVGEPLTILLPHRFRSAHEDGLSRVVETGETRIIGQTVEVFGLHEDGHEFPIELSLATWLEGGKRFFSGIIRDITERFEMTRALTASEQRLDAILESANDAIISLDSLGRVVLWNPRAEDIFGYTGEEMFGEALTAVIPERFRSEHVEGISRVTSGGERHVIGQTVELAGVHRDGREFPLELSLATWEADGQRFYSGIIRDITERKKAEDALQVANKSLNEKNDQLEALSGKLAKYLSRQVYDSIFEGKTDVQVQSYRKELTVFFSDIEGFTELTDRLEAEVVSEILNTYLSEMATIADGCGGTIDKFIGDGIMIFFGDPESRGKKKDAIECVGMAVRMKDRISELRSDWAEMIGPEPLHVRVGINTGYCTVGNFGSEDRLDYTIVGGAVNVASRLEATAAADQIQISHSTYSLVKDTYYCRPIGDVSVKGISHQLRTYEVVAEYADLGPGKRIESEIGDFRVSLDPSNLDSESAEKAREALRSALAALGEVGD